MVLLSGRETLSVLNDRLIIDYVLKTCGITWTLNTHGKNFAVPPHPGGIIAGPIASPAMSACVPVNISINLIKFISAFRLKLNACDRI